MFIRHSRPNFSPYHIPSDSHRYVAYIYVLLRLLPRIARTHITFQALEGRTHNPIFSFLPPFFQRLKGGEGGGRDSLAIIGGGGREVRDLTNMKLFLMQIH